MPVSRALALTSSLLSHYAGFGGRRVLGFGLWALGFRRIQHKYASMKSEKCRVYTEAL